VSAFDEDHENGSAASAECRRLREELRQLWEESERMVKAVEVAQREVITERQQCAAASERAEKAAASNREMRAEKLELERQAGKVPGLEKRLAETSKYKDGAAMAKAAEKKAASLEQELKQLQIDTADQKAELGHLKTQERERHRARKEKADAQRGAVGVLRPPTAPPLESSSGAGTIQFVAGQEGEDWAWYQKPLKAAPGVRRGSRAGSPSSRPKPPPEGLRIQIQAEEWKPNLGTILTPF